MIGLDTNVLVGCITQYLRRAARGNHRAPRDLRPNGILDHAVEHVPGGTPAGQAPREDREREPSYNSAFEWPLMRKDR